MPQSRGESARPTGSDADRDVTALSPVTQDYLKVIWTSQEWAEVKVTTKMLAESLGVSPSTASEAIRKLADQGLVSHERYGAVTLTDSGRAAAILMVRRHRLLETFLVRELGYGWDEVHDEAEVLEHAVSDRLMARLDAKLGYPQRDPHGDPIPAADGTKKPPVMIHSAKFGSIERFFGVLTEHYAGAFPGWLAPEQVVGIPVAEQFGDHLETVIRKLRAEGIRAHVDHSDDRMQKKIRNHTTQKVQFMLLAGETDRDAGAVSFRFRDGIQVNQVPVDEAVQ